MNRVRILAGTALAAAVLAVAACGGHHAPSAASSSDAARAKAMASSTAVAQGKAALEEITAKCGTGTAAGQVAALKDLGSHAGRQALLAKCGVPKDKMNTVEVQLVAAAEKAHLVKGGHAARVEYFTVTLPGVIAANQS